MREQFITRKFHDGSLKILDDAQSIISEYTQKGFVLTLRQLYYQFVARGLLPENTIKTYNKLGTLINKARLAGIIDWDAIEDRTRNLQYLAHWRNPPDAIDSIRYHYRLNKWDTQPNYCEVWVEKEALAGVMARICNNLDVPYFACRGYVSQSEQYAAGKRLMYEAKKRGRRVMVFHLGDHDPSGVDMTRDNELRLEMFSNNKVVVERLALNMHQVTKYNPPPNPAKTTDTRHRWYVEQYGHESWELDALDPEVLVDLVRDAVDPLIDRAEWDRVLEQERTDRAMLEKVVSEWDTVREALVQ